MPLMTENSASGNIPLFNKCYRNAFNF